MRIPSVELVGKNANGRDVTIRVDIDHLPTTDEQWYEMAVAAGLPADLDKSRGNIVVGNHNGFGGSIKSFDTLDHVLRAAQYVREIDARGLPESKDILQRHAHTLGVHVLDLWADGQNPPLVIKFANWRDAVGYANPFKITDHTDDPSLVFGFMDTVYDRLDGLVSWRDVIATSRDDMWTYETPDGSVWLVHA